MLLVPLLSDKGQMEAFERSSCRHTSMLYVVPLQTAKVGPATRSPVTGISSVKGPVLASHSMLELECDMLTVLALNPGASVIWCQTPPV